MDAEKLIEELEKKGIPFVIVEVKLTEEQCKRQETIEKAVIEYIMNIREAHQKDANSTLLFGATWGAEFYSAPLSVC